MIFIIFFLSNQYASFLQNSLKFLNSKEMETIEIIIEKIEILEM